MMSYRKKLIEVALPLPEINDASAYDKMPGIGPHPKGIHQWWARLPLPVARSVLFASVVDDPSSNPEKFPTDEAQSVERERLFGIVRRMMQKQLHKKPEVYAEARREMLTSCKGKLPPVLDPFAGGGSIPLEASRLGFEAHASDLNLVCVLLNKCNLELIPEWIDFPPVNPNDRKKIGGTSNWNGARGLAADIRHYKDVIAAKARAQLSHLYPSVKVTSEMADGRSDLRGHEGIEFPVIAWIWAHTVPSPDPAARGHHVPLMSTFWLSSKGTEVYLEPIVDRSSASWRFGVRVGKPEDRATVKAGTKTGRATFRCVLTGSPIEDNYIKTEAQAGRLGTALIAIVAEGPRGRIYLPADENHAAIARTASPSWKPEELLSIDPRNIWCVSYGLKTFADLFTPRQLTAMVAISDLVKAIRMDVRRDAALAGLSEAKAESYAQAVVTFLGLSVDRCADFNNALCRWSPSNQKVMNLFGRQAIPMVWDFAEANILGTSVGAWSTCSDYVADCVEVFTGHSGGRGHARQIDAASAWDGLNGVLVSTDPPYYDNISYAALSDFFYVWLRRTIGNIHSELFQTILVPKTPELVAAPERFQGDKLKAKEHFEIGFRRAFSALREKMHPDLPLTVYYAFKQDDQQTGSSEEETNGTNTNTVDLTTGWETMLEALVGTGFQITGTWPVRASQKWRMVSMGTNALASYIVLACRIRPETAPQTDRRSFLAELKRELPPALKRLQQGNIAPVDFAQAAIGPGMAIYSRYSRIVEASGQPLAVRPALALINQTLTEVLSEQEDEFDSDTRWAIAWFEQHGFEAGDFGDAELLSKAKVTSVEGLHRAGIISRGGGKVQLLAPSRLPVDWDPDRDARLTVWEVVHQLIRIFESKGEAGAAAVTAKLGSTSEVARELAYRLYSICERKKWAQEAVSYNGLVQSWPEITRLAREGAKTRPQQAGMFT
jgi:putative DNA methylase